MRILLLNSLGGSMGHLSHALNARGHRVDCIVNMARLRRHLVHGAEANVWSVYQDQPSEWGRFLRHAIDYYDIIHSTSLPLRISVAQNYDWLTATIGDRHVWRITGFIHRYVYRPDVLDRQPDCQMNVRTFQVRDGCLHTGTHPVTYSWPEKGTYLRGDNTHWLPTIRHPDDWLWTPSPLNTTPYVFVPGAHGGASWKGTTTIMRVLRELEADGAIRVSTPDGRPYATPWWQMAAAYRSADIVVDQLRMGCYGNCGTEAMLIGRPVISCNRYPETAAAPVVVADDADDLRDAVLRLAGDSHLRDELGKAGREYAERVHGPDAVARKAEAIYEAIV